jgi:hypothetical protein
MNIYFVCTYVPTCVPSTYIVFTLLKDTPHPPRKHIRHCRRFLVKLCLLRANNEETRSFKSQNRPRRRLLPEWFNFEILACEREGLQSVKEPLEKRQIAEGHFIKG